MPSPSRFPLWIVKIGGSLLDLPGFQDRLQTWLSSNQLQKLKLLFLVGGGPTTDVIRDFDRIHRLGEEKSHWLALRALSLNTALLADILPQSQIVEHPSQVLEPGLIYLLDPYVYCRYEWIHQNGPFLEPSWQSGSDVIAGHLAIVGQAEELILMKSTAISPNLTLSEAIQQGVVDKRLQGLLEKAEVEIRLRIVNLRCDPPSTTQVALRSAWQQQGPGHSPTTPAKILPNRHG